MSTTLNCIQWMVNQEGQTPCVTAQEVGQLCNNEYTVSLMNFEESNYIPNATTANGCTCSWSIYNLLSACSYCVGQYQYPSWSAWIMNCSNYASNISYLPSGLSLSQGIPFWAVTNPSTWENETFSITQAADKAAQDQPDVTGGAISTSTTATSSSSSVPVGSIIGLVIGAFAIIVIGGLFILWALCCRRRQRTRMAPVAAPSFNPSQSAVVPPVRDQPPASPTSSGYARTSSLYRTPLSHSTTSLVPTSLVARVSSGISPAAPSISLVTDAADMIAPFLATSSSRQTDPASQTGKAIEALSERVMAPPGGQRARLNPPPYSESAASGSSEPALAWATPKVSTRKRTQWTRSVSVATTHSRDSRPSTRESVATILAGARTEQSQPLHVALTDSMGAAPNTEDIASTGGVDGDDGHVETTHGDRREGDSDRYAEV